MIPKYLQREIENCNLMIFDEKHGKRYFLCNDTQEFCKAAMFILKERLEAGWYYDDPDDFSAETAKYTGVVMKFPKPVKAETEAKEIVAKNDLEAALEFIHSRSDWEYERVEFERSEDFSASG